MESPYVGEVFQLHVKASSSVADVRGRYHNTYIHVQDARGVPKDSSPLKVEIVERDDAGRYIAEPTEPTEVFKKDDIRGAKNDHLNGHL